MTLSVAIVFCLFGFCIAEPTWTTLRVTWGLKIWNSKIFARMPLTIGETEEKGFLKLPGDCDEGLFRGNRYIKGKDPAVILIYDSKGYIAGMQTGIPTNLVDNLNISYQFSINPAFQIDSIDGQSLYILTVYFMDPNSICESKRTQDEFDENIGNGLWIQNGSDSSLSKSSFNAVKVPLYENEISGNWTRGGCFPTMGRHYWYNLSKQMSCDKVFPFYVMLNRNKITGFGFAYFGDLKFSERLEHPHKDSLSRLLDPVPDCFKEEYDRTGGLTTIHVYFTVRPWNLFC